MPCRNCCYKSRVPRRGGYVFRIRVAFRSPLCIGHVHDPIPIAVQDQNRVRIVRHFRIYIIVPHIGNIVFPHVDPPVKIELLRHFIQRVKLFMDCIVNQQRRVEQNQSGNLVRPAGRRHRAGHTALAGANQGDTVNIYKIPFFRRIQYSFHIGGFCHHRHSHCGAIAAACGTAAPEIKSIGCNAARSQFLRVLCAGAMGAAQFV